MAGTRLRAAALATSVALLVSGCGDGGDDPGAVGSSAAPVGADLTTPSPVVSEPGRAPAGDGEVPDEQVLCGAVDETPIEAALGEPITIRAFHPPSGTGTNVSCNWETVTKSITVKYYLWPDFRMLVDDDILDEYGEGEFDGVGVEAYRTVYRGIIMAGPHGWGVEVVVVGTINPTDAELAAIGQAALTAADLVT